MITALVDALEAHTGEAVHRYGRVWHDGEAWRASWRGVTVARTATQRAALRELVAALLRTDDGDAPCVECTAAPVALVSGRDRCIECEVAP